MSTGAVTPREAIAIEKKALSSQAKCEEVKAYYVEHKAKTEQTLREAPIGPATERSRMRLGRLVDADELIIEALDEIEFS